ncbi:MAG: polysaccharide lyase family 7 protein [Myxococcaceae bacterium]
MLPLAAKPVGRATLPSDVLKLSNWKLTLPVGKAERPTEIKQPMLRNFQDPTYFRLSEDKTGVVFRAHTGGTTTRGSGYPRSELREMANKGASTASWSTSSGMHRMYIKQAILKTPATKQHVVAGQIHDAKDDIVVIRLEKAKLFVDVNGRTGPTLDKAYTLGKVFEVEFVASDGKIDIFYNRGATPVYTLRKAAAGCYFKAGVYTQSNVATEGNRTAYGEVAIFDLRVSHQ